MKPAVLGTWSVHAPGHPREGIDAPDAMRAADNYVKTHQLTDGFVFVRDGTGHERRFRVLSKGERKKRAKEAKAKR